MKARRKLWAWALAVVATFALVLGLSPLALAATGDTPPHTKNLTDNHDGTYTLSLDVVGESEKKPNNVNVIVIFDTSGSMNTTRMNAAKNAVNSLANSLFAYNTASDSDTVQMALVSFSTHARTASTTPTSNANTFRTAVNGLSANGGTNWEAALQTASAVDFGDDDQTFVVFVSDGNPTFRNTQGTTRITDNRWYRYDDIYFDDDGVYGLGSDNPSYQNYSPQSMQYCYNHAVDDAQALATKVTPGNFFTIGAFGNVDRMEQLTDDAGSDSSTNYYNASDTAALNQAISDILAKIEMAGFGNASIDDGTTNQVTTTSGDIAELLEVDTSSFKYYRSGGTYGTMQPWSDAPAATFKDGAVDWDLSSVGVLENGVRYTVTFDCYPSQYTYDTIAKLKNGDITYDSLDAEVKKYIVDNGGGSYSLRTNTNATLSWDDTRDDAGQQTTGYTNPDPVPTNAATMSVTKAWENELDARKVGSIDMTVTMDGETFHKVTLSDPSWTAEGIFISPGIIKGGKVLPGAEGHDFTFAELGSEQYNWELVAPVVHPMLIDGTLTMLTMVDDAHPAPAGAQTYTIDGNTYFSNGSSAASLDAYNYRRSNLNLTKVVTGEDAPAGATFPFTLTVNNSKAASGSAEDLNSDYWVWFSIYDTKAKATVTNATVTGATGPNADGYYYAPSGTAITVQMKDGWNLRFTNLPTGTTYSFVEGGLADGFAFNKAELSGGEDSTFSGGKTTTGTVENTNTSYQVTFTNDYQLTNLEITKVWDDADNQDGKRLTADELKSKLTLSPAVDGAEPTVVDNGDGTFTITYKDLPRFSNNQEVTYTVAEGAIDGYTTTGSPAEDHGTITNKHTPELINIDVVKKWIGPEGDEITVTLYADGVATENAVKLNADNKWAGSFTDLPKYADGEEIDYTVEEDSVSGVDPDKYTTAIAGDAKTGFVITNTNVEKTSVTATKTWDDADNQDGIRPTELTLTLNGLPEGTTAPEPTVAKDGNSWTYTWTGLPKYDKTTGEELEYTVTEGTVPEGYTCETTTVAAGGTITNVHTPDETTVKVTKAWDDADNQDGKRPESVTVQLKADGENYGEAVTLNAAGNWTYTWENLPVNKAGEAIKYTVEETPVPTGYTVAVTGDAATGFTVTNSYTPEVTTATVTKVWDDNDDQDGKRPTELEVTLLADGKATETTETLSADNNWTATATGLPKFADGKEIKYTWTEGTIREYELVSNVTEGTSTTITNKHEIEKTQFTVTKIWEDADNQDGARPASVVIELLADGTKVNEVTLNEQNEWTHTFTNLDKYAEGEEIVYTATESNVPTSYTATVEAVEGGAEITNTHTPSTININGTKTWDDADNQDGKRPETITVNLLADGVKVDSKTVSAPWTYSFEGMPEFAAGKKIVYTVTEETVADYDPTITGYDIKNTHLPEKIDIEVEKKWEDADNQDGKRPEQIIINLLADGEVIDSATVTAAEDGTWTHSWTGLDKYAAGEEIEYTVTEEPVDEYTTEIDGYLVINTHELEKTTVTVSKTWNDAENQDGKRPGSITINLFGDGEAVKSASVTPDADGNWTYTFEGLPKYAEGKQGVEIVYTVTEDKVDEYETTIDGFDVTNTHAPEKTEVSVTKVWDDADNQDGKRPGSVTVNLLADGEATGKTLTLSEENSWTGTFTELDKYKAGKEIAYSVTEDEVAEYKTAITGSAANGFTVTNTHEPELIDVPVTKVWEDADDQDGKRADVVTVALLADGEDAGKTVELSEDNSWTATFTDLPKYKAGEEIDYSVRENEVAGYEVAIEGTVADGYTVTNTHEPEKTEVKVTKVWDDANDKDGIRPAEITVTLLANGTEAGTATLNEGNSWTYTWTELDKYAAGEEIAYTVSEEQVKDYDEPAISGDAKDGFTITNFHKAQPDSVFVDPPVQKVVQGSPKTAGTFTFQLKAVTKDAPMPAESGNGIKTIQITGAGSKEFGKIEYTKPGEYVYEITELKGSDDGYTYDTTVYTLTVKVEEVADGTQFKLVKTETVTGGNGSIVFTNVYQPPIPKAGDVTPMISQIAGIAAAGSALIAAGVVRRRRED